MYTALTSSTPNRRGRRRGIRGAALFAAATLLVAACGGDDDAADADPPAPAATAEAPEPTEAPEPQSTEAPDSDAADAPEPDTTDEPSDAETDGGADAAAALEELIAAAQEEGELVFYSVPGETLAQAAGEAFQETYGINFEFVRLTTPDTAARLTAEDDANATVADVALITATGVYPALLEAGIFTRMDEAIPSYPEILPQPIPEEFVVEEWGTAVPLARPAVIAYNTDLVSEDEVPQSHEDLIDPRWEGEVATINPMESASYLDSWFQFLNLYGEDFITSLVDNGLRLEASSAPATQALGAGEVSIVFGAPSGQPRELQLDGAPVDWVIPDETTGSNTVIGIVDDAPHPNAARLFAYFLLTQEGSSTLLEAEGDVTPFEGTLPSGYEVFEPDDIPEETQQRIFELLGLR